MAIYTRGPYPTKQEACNGASLLGEDYWVIIYDKNAESDDDAAWWLIYGDHPYPETIPVPS